MAKKEIIIKKKILFKYKEIKSLSLEEFQKKLKCKLERNRKK